MTLPDLFCGFLHVYMGDSMKIPVDPNKQVYKSSKIMKKNSCSHKVGPLLVITGVITPLIGVITTVTYL